MVTPAGAPARARSPAILRLHGGPVWEFFDAFDLHIQLFAAQGYVVLYGNPRGSSGRGDDFAKAIWADWGVKDVPDVLALVDWAIARGIVDPARLGVGGHSYGAILTDQVIARTTRFKAAIADAGQGSAIGGYGVDQYVREYEAELGLPWQHPDVWQHVSYPFFHADKITTPTLFICGEKDYNVALPESEQMYQALRSVGVPTQLVIYPGQFHEFTRPSYIVDRLHREVAWYDRYLSRQGER